MATASAPVPFPASEPFPLVARAPNLLVLLSFRTSSRTTRSKALHPFLRRSLLDRRSMRWTSSCRRGPRDSTYSAHALFSPTPVERFSNPKRLSLAPRPQSLQCPAASSALFRSGHSPRDWPPASQP